MISLMIKNDFFSKLFVSKLIFNFFFILFLIIGWKNLNFVWKTWKKIRNRYELPTNPGYYFLWTKLIWSIDFVISKKKFFIDFLDELELFIGEKQVFAKKKPSLCRLPWIHGCPHENVVLPIFERSFQVRDFSFWITEGIGPTGVIFVFLTSETNSVGELPYEFLAPFSLPCERFTNFYVFGLDLT
jgi:hypothetical protein